MTQSDVIFIGGNSRSGSTLLESMLGTMKDFVQIGELRYIWKRSFKENQLCGCNSPFVNCEFWNEVFKDAFGSITNVDFEKMLTIQKKFDNVNKFVNLSNIQTVKKDTVELDEYLLVLDMLYKSIKTVSGKKYILDSSKAPSHGFLLSRSKNINLHTIHLVRDSRAVAHSQLRKKIRPEIHWKKEYMPRSTVLKSSMRWFLVNNLMESLLVQSYSSARIKYEDMVKKPYPTIKSIITQLEIPIDIEVDSFLEVNNNNSKICLKGNHSVAGNPMRFKTGELNLDYDGGWESKMNRIRKETVKLITYSQLKKYNYLG